MSEAPVYQHISQKSGHLPDILRDRRLKFRQWSRWTSVQAPESKPTFESSSVSQWLCDLRQVT